MDEETKPERRKPVVLDDLAVRSIYMLTPPPDLLTQQQNLLRFLEDMERLPVQNPDDCFSGRDHDAILYRPRR
jgi:hypothetical protein